MERQTSDIGAFIEQMTREIHELRAYQDVQQVRQNVMEQTINELNLTVQMLDPAAFKLMFADIQSNSRMQPILKYEELSLRIQKLETQNHSGGLRAVELVNEEVEHRTNAITLS